MELLEPERQAVPLFPYEESKRLTQENLASITKGAKEWTDQNFKADDSAFFDARITRRLQDGSLTSKFAKNREKLQKKLTGLSWLRPSEVYHSLYDFSLFKTINETDIK